ncbi:helix-turn-helix transcriptional regulator [Rubellicoccus peritrichatus]|uniref:Helix-turn-helix transcriptional regulator n=1 Tax=Rubellicoccus peritrichatus TaxID=3080537 RepID=A0AAQ3LD36_9BACT|nr:helix-turn-helix transcriptional regulator [Puniceicoccus sp. CR14]WOO43271.1 helix-turn-helix transcriptional regulator [Puniceicoccus sp. CR14]
MSDWAHLKTELYWVYEGKVRPQYLTLTPKEYPDNHPAYLIRKGSVLVETDFGTITADEGHWVLPGDAIKRRDFSEDAEILSIRFAIEWPDGKPCLDWDVALSFPSADFPKLEEKAIHMLDAIEEIMPEANTRFRFSRGNLGDHLRIRERFIAWLGCLVEISETLNASSPRLEHMDERVFEAARLIDRHPLDLEFVEKELADAVHLSISQLDRLFTKEFGQTPKQYLDQRRMQTATAQLQTSSIPVKQLSYNLGFNSLSYFSRWFRSKTGLSPREYREANKLKPDSE